MRASPNFHVSGNLYIPTTGNPPYPGVLFQMGHTTNGKAGDLYQRCCQGLARLGYLVLGFDPMGQGERIYYPVEGGMRSRLGADEEHTYPGRQMLLKGISSVRLQTWDAVRSLDYLAAHPLVDPKRLASTGQSGGGTNTMLLAAIDDRLSVAAVSSGNTENVACANFNPPGSTDDAEQDLAGSGPLGFDRWDLLVSARSQAAADPGEQPRLFRHVLAELSRQRHRGVSEAAQGLHRCSAMRTAWPGSPLPCPTA